MHVTAAAEGVGPVLCDYLLNCSNQISSLSLLEDDNKRKWNSVRVCAEDEERKEEIMTSVCCDTEIVSSAVKKKKSNCGFFLNK